MEKKLQNIYLICYNLLLVHNLWQAHYQILIIFQKEFIKLNVNTDTMIKNVKLTEVNFKDDLIECKCLCCNKNYQQKYDGKLKE